MLKEHTEERVALRTEAAEEAGRLAQRREPVRDDGLVVLDEALQLTQGADVGLELQPVAAERPAAAVRRSLRSIRPTHLALSANQLKAAS